MWELDILLDFCTETVLYVPVVFRSSGVVILFLLGWSINIQGFISYKIPYQRVLGLQNNVSQAVQAQEVVAAVKLLSAILLVCYLLYEVCGLYHLGYGQSVTLVLFWFILAGLSVWSPQLVFKQLRGFLSKRVRTLLQAKPPKFVDVLAADVLTSMSKLLADMEIVLCAVLTVLFYNTEGVESACLHSVVGPILASIPYAIRAYQCLLSYQSTGSTLQLINFGKYISAFPVIWTSALKHALAPMEGVALDKHDEHLQILWLYSVTINTLYSFVWDVTMDWGLALDAESSYPLLRPDLRYCQHELLLDLNPLLGLRTLCFITVQWSWT